MSDTTSYVTSVTTITIPPMPTTYITTYEAVEPIPSAKTSTWTVTELFTTTLSASTITSTTAIETITPSTEPSTSIAGSFLTTRDTSTSIDTTSTTATGITIVTESSNSHTTTILLGVLVPLGVIGLVVLVWVIKKHGKARSRNGSTGFAIKHWFNRSESDLRKTGNQNTPPIPTTAGEYGSFRVTSPPRPLRPSSITESILNVMSVGSDSNIANASSNGGLASTELAHLKSPRCIDDHDVDEFVPNIDGTSVYDGTRKVYLRTALQHNMPLSLLTRASLRSANAPRPNGHRQSAYIPQPLKIHKKNLSDTTADRNASRHLNDLEGVYPSPVPTEQEFVTNVRRGLSKIPPLERVVTEHADLMVDASSEGGSFIKEEYNEIFQKRDSALAHLEGRTPADNSSNWDARNVFGRQIPPRIQGPIPEHKLAARRQANVVDEDVIQNWI